MAACVYGALDTAKIQQITGLKGKLNEAEHVFKVSAPRSEPKIAVDLFLRYWGRGAAVDLARAVKGALDTTKARN
jgi:hypothetical protein